MMKLVIPLDTVPQGRPRFFNGHAVDPPKSRKFKRDVAAIVKSQFKLEKVFADALKVKIEIYRSAEKFKGKLTSRNYGDIDNLAKGILDALTGIVWGDDAQVVELHVYKLLGDEPSITIAVTTCET